MRALGVRHLTKDMLCMVAPQHEKVAIQHLYTANFPIQFRMLGDLLARRMHARMELIISGASGPYAPWN